MTTPTDTESTRIDLRTIPEGRVLIERTTALSAGTN